MSFALNFKMGKEKGKRENNLSHKILKWTSKTKEKKDKECWSCPTRKTRLGL